MTDSISMIEPDTEWVLVDCISTFRTRYVVEVPTGKIQWASTKVSCNEAKDFSQKHLGEQIVSSRVISKEEALEICDNDNSYTANWTIANKIKSFFTSWTKP